MQPFTKVTSVAAPLDRANVDTDVIIPLRRLTSLPQDQLGPYAFEALRYGSDGIENPDFVLNRPTFKNAKILIAGPNFGCGSSREAAVWALMGAGLQVYISSEFGDIFYDNCFQNGALPIRKDEKIVAELMRYAATGRELLVDLEAQTISFSGDVVGFGIDAWRKEALLIGLDGIQLTLREREMIATWQEYDKKHRAWAWLPDAR